MPTPGAAEQGCLDGLAAGPQVGVHCVHGRYPALELLYGCQHGLVGDLHPVQFGKCLDRAERARFDDFRAEVLGGIEHRFDGLAGMPAHDEVRLVAVVLEQDLRNADMSGCRQQGQNPRLSQDIVSADRRSAWWRRLDDDPLKVTRGQHDRRPTGDARVPPRQILEAGELARRPHLSDAFGDPVTQFGH